jgi:inositol-hexakisphosphate/diphosphoinositol-pentakisphosphate 1-kinase
MQELLLDRRLVGKVLDILQVPSPRRLVASRDGGPKVSPQIKKIVFENLGLELEEVVPPAKVELIENGEAISVNGEVMWKPFVEKPVSGEDHNINIYFKGGGGRRLFRKVIYVSAFQYRSSNTRVDWQQV